MTKTIDIRVPEAGESITQVELARWLVEDGAVVEKDQEIAEIDSDKATLTINAEAAGRIHITTEEGSTVEPGNIIGRIDTSVQQRADKDEGKEKGKEKTGDKDKGKEKDLFSATGVTVSPQARKLMDEEGLSAEFASTSHPDSKRITKKDILAAIAHQHAEKVRPGKDPADHAASATWGGGREIDRQKMSTLRKKVAERLVAVKNQTAMLTTFNEVDMSAVIAIRKQHQSAFTEKFGIKLGLMSFFVKAVTESIPYFPQVNAHIDGNQIVLPGYADVGIAVSTPKGLMVPVIRNAESRSLSALEIAIHEMADRARTNKITIEELSGGTISITNGGVFGSMLSTPILNPPQSAILGMHNIVERPVAINGNVEIRPMMYLALSYDHRIIDGKESVSFLVKVKEMIEDPARMLLKGQDPAQILLGLQE